MSYKVWRPFPHPRCWQRWPAMNRRRCDLIDRDINGVITVEEKGELQYLQKETDTMLNKWFPRPPTPNLDQLIERLEGGQES